MKRNCLEPDELKLVLQGRLDPDDFESAIHHLDQCGDCRSAAESLRTDQLTDSPASASRFDDEAESLQRETACQVALQNLISDRSVTPIQNEDSVSLPFQTLGPYRLLELIGCGGMGAVYLAEHQRLRRRCAIKLLPPERVSQPGWLDRFDREMTTIASLEHPNVVRATDAGHQAGWHYLVMEFLDGLDIGRVARRMGPLRVADACEIIRQAASGLAHIHDSGLVHRDIKPSNLMLTRKGTVKLLDLGLVLPGDDPLSADERLTTVGHVMGTMPYMAPEQLADSRVVKPQSDIYALGATLYRLIAGQPPHRSGFGLAAQVLAITHQDATPLDRVRDDVDPDVVQLVSQMLARDPQQRPASAMEVADRLSEPARHSELRQLVRQALRKPDDPASDATRLFPTVPSGNRDGGRIGWARWLLGAAAIGLLLAAALVIKIQTDRGELVIHSEQDGLSVAIKQGDQLVERLQVHSGDDNRTTLHKGTYQVEIEGGGPALVLSEDVVTIGRGQQRSIEVTRDAREELQEETASATPSDANQSSPALDLPLASSAFEPSYDGKTVSQWIEVIRSESDLNQLGAAMFAAVRAVTPPHPGFGGYGDQSKNQRRLADAILMRARTLGTSSSEIPPLVSVDASSENAKQHFMWYVTRVFPDPDKSIWLDALAEELENGNGRSRAACLYLITEETAKSGLYLSPTTPGLSKFTLSRLLRAAIGLLTSAEGSQQWGELPDEQRKVAIENAYGLAFNITAGLGEDPQEIPALRDYLQRFNEDEKDHRDDMASASATERGGDADQQDGTAQQDGTDQQDAVRDDDANSVQAVFQGRTLDQWMEALQRERDMGSLGQAMLAVERLSRDSAPAVRSQAAETTMALAQRWGGIVIGGDGNPSHQFMAFFLDVFVEYLPTPGRDVLITELNTGNTRSKIAGIWALNNFLDGVVDSAEQPGRARAVEREMKSISQDPAELATWMALRDGLLDAGDEIKESDVVSPSDAETSSGLARNAALKLTRLLGQSVADSERLSEFVKAKIRTAMNRPENSGNYGQTWIDQAILMAAVEVAEGDPDFGSQAVWDFLATEVMSSTFYVRNADIAGAFESIQKQSPQRLLEQVEKAMLTSGNYNLQNGGYTIFDVALPFYADQVEDPGHGLKTLQQFGNARAASPYPSQHEETISAARKTLQDRMTATKEKR
ncbi:serine/threonine protein kinase [Roseiconus nitratireducens]|nr:serine/threonine-protein kinase [Roseiconus nitratireducens]